LHASREMSDGRATGARHRRARRIAPSRWVASGAAALALHCATSGAAQPARVAQAPPAPAPATRFQSAVTSLREQVELLRVSPGPPGDQGVRRAVATLADAIEDVPDARGVDVVDAARTMREDFPDDIGGGQRNAPHAAAQARRALETAAGALSLLAGGPYAGVRGLATRVRALRQATDAIAPDERIDDQRPRVVEALARAVDAVAAL